MGRQDPVESAHFGSGTNPISLLLLLLFILFFLLGGHGSKKPEYKDALVASFPVSVKLGRSKNFVYTNLLIRFEWPCMHRSHIITVGGWCLGSAV